MMPRESPVLDPSGHPSSDEPRGFLRERPRLGVLQSVRRHLILAALPMAVLVLLAVAYSLKRTPVYSAEARMSVGRIDLSAPGALNGFATATAALASAYSRALAAEEVVNKVAVENRIDPQTVRSRLSSTPIPDSPLFRVQATGSTREEALRLANDASKALQVYVKTSGDSPNPASAALLKSFRDKQVRVSLASQRLTRAQDAVQDAQTAANRVALARAQAGFSAAKLEADTASTAYTNSVAASTTGQSVDILAPAAFATNDRRSTLQIYAFAALIVGAFIGAALATLTEDRRYRRSYLSVGARGR